MPRQIKRTVYTFRVPVSNLDEALSKIEIEFHDTNYSPLSSKRSSCWEEIEYNFFEDSDMDGACHARLAPHYIYKYFDWGIPHPTLEIEVTELRSRKILNLRGDSVLRALKALGIPTERLLTKLKARQENCEKNNEIDIGLDGLLPFD